MRFARARSTWQFSIFLQAFLAGSGNARAQEDVVDGGVGATLASGEAAEKGLNRVPWHDSVFVWDHSVTTQTLGIGPDYQSRNPTYEMTFRLAPRYYVIEAARRNLSVRVDLRLVRELTDSDSTTRRGEWTFADSELWLAYVQRLHETPGQATDFVLRAPSFLFPTSKVSARGGRTLGLGFGAGVDQELPLRGVDKSFLASVVLRPRLSYTYQFVSSIVPANDAIDRVRLDPEGRSVPSDQLDGSAFPRHLMNLTLRTETQILERLNLSLDFGMRYAHRYALRDSVEVCGVVATGCVVVDSRESATRWGVSTLFAAEVAYSLTEYLEIGLGYVNLALQLGTDGRRRSVFYSPDARAALSFNLLLDALYQGAKPLKSALAPSFAGARL